MAASQNPLYKLTEGGNRRRTKKISKRLRDKVRARDNETCQQCGTSGTPPFFLDLEIDHTVPYCDGGAMSMENLLLLCIPCHRSKSKIEAAARRRAR